MKNNYFSSYDELAFTDEEKTRMKAKLVEQARELQNGTESDMGNIVEFNPARKKSRFAAAAAVALALVLGSGGIAYATGNLENVMHYFDELFNGPAPQTEIVEKIGHPIDASATDSGITITADAVIGDRSSFAVVYSLEKTDGTPFDTTGDTATPYLSYSFDEGLATPEFGLLEAGANGMAGEAYFYDADPSDPKIQYVEKQSLMGADSQVDVIGKTVRVHFGELTRFNGNGEAETVAKGDWNLRFKIDYEDTTREVPVKGEQFSLLNGEAEMRDMTISPLSLRFHYVADEPAHFDEDSGEDGRMSENDERETNRLLDLGEIVFTMRDGTQIVQEDHSGGSIEADGRTCEKVQFLDTLLEMDKLESITIGGTVFTVA